MRNCLLLLLVHIHLIAASQTLNLPENKATLQTTTYSKRQTEAFSFTSNQAALAYFTRPSFGIYGERKFMLEELSLFAASVVLPTHSGNFGFTGRRFGSVNYSESETGLAYGRKLGKRVAVGTQFNYHLFKIKGYGSAGYLSVDAGGIFQLSDAFQAGFHVYKPAGSVGDKNEKILQPSVYELGIGYDVSDQLFISAIACQADKRGLQVNAAIQYSFAKSLLCKAGITSGTSSFYLGAGVYLKHFRIDAVTSFHPHLGLTPGILLLYQSPENNAD